MSRFIGITVAVLSLVGTTEVARGQDVNAESQAMFEGRWRLVPSTDEAARAVSDAVEEAVTPMNFFVRGIARDRLRAGTEVDSVIELDLDGRQITVRFGARASYVTPIGRTVRRRRPDGTAVTVTQRFDADGNLEQVFQTETGTRWYQYRRTGDGRVRLVITTSSDRLPQPMRLRLDYRRDPS